MDAKELYDKLLSVEQKLDEAQSNGTTNYVLAKDDPYTSGKRAAIEEMRKLNVEQIRNLLQLVVKEKGRWETLKNWVEEALTG